VSKFKPVCLYNGTVLTGFAAMEHCAVLTEDGVISDVFSQKRFEKKQFNNEVESIDVHGAYIAPGLIDTHIHGFGGFGTEDSGINEPAGTEAILAMSKLLARRGVTAFNPTLYPSEPEHMLRAVSEIVSAMGR
jgi:N-acetylglucosamine-6-phosphate deacetylase